MSFIYCRISRSSVITGTKHGWVFIDCIRKRKSWRISSISLSKFTPHSFLPCFSPGPLWLWDQSMVISGEWFGEGKGAISGKSFPWFSPGSLPLAGYVSLTCPYKGWALHNFLSLVFWLFGLGINGLNLMVCAIYIRNIESIFS